MSEIEKKEQRIDYIVVDGVKTKIGVFSFPAFIFNGMLVILLGYLIVTVSFITMKSAYILAISLFLTAQLDYPDFGNTSALHILYIKTKWLLTVKIKKKERVELYESLQD